MSSKHIFQYLAVTGFMKHWSPCTLITVDKDYLQEQTSASQSKFASETRNIPHSWPAVNYILIQQAPFYQKHVVCLYDENYYRTHQTNIKNVVQNTPNLYSKHWYTENEMKFVQFFNIQMWWYLHPKPQETIPLPLARLKRITFFAWLTIHNCSPKIAFQFEYYDTI